MVIPKLWGFKKSTNLFMGFRSHPFLKIGTLEIVKNRFRQKKENEIIFFKKNGIFDQKLQFLRFFRNSQSKVRNSSFLLL